MPVLHIRDIEINFAKHAYTIHELVDDIFRNKLDEQVRTFCKNNLGIQRVHKAYDLRNMNIEDSQYVMPTILLNDMYVEVAKKVMYSAGVCGEDIGFLITINDNLQYLDPAPTVEVASRLGLKRDIRTQNLQGMACSSFSEALRNAAGYYALGYEGEVLVLIGTYYTQWFLDRLKQINHVSMEDGRRKDFNSFIYFLIFSDVTAAAIISRPNQPKKNTLAEINIEAITSLKDTSPDGYKKATIKLSPDNLHRITFDMDVNSKRLKESISALSSENLARLKEIFPMDFQSVKSWGFHTAGRTFVDYVRRSCSIEEAKCKLTDDLMLETGNTGAVSSLQLIKESIERRILRKGELGGIIDYGWEGADAFLYKSMK